MRKKEVAENLLKWIARSLVCKVDVVIFHWWRKKWMDEKLFKWNCPFIRSNKGQHSQASSVCFFGPSAQAYTAKCWDMAMILYKILLHTNTNNILNGKKMPFLLNLTNYLWEYPLWFQLLKRIFFPILGSVFFCIICSALQGTDISKCTHKPAKVKFVSLHSKVMWSPL
jgi:hypothetical protein